MAHSRPESLYKRASENSLVGYSALPSASSFGSPDTHHSFTPSAYEFSILSRDSLVPAEGGDEGAKTGGGRWRRHGTYHELGSDAHREASRKGRPTSGGRWFCFWFSLFMGLLWVLPAVALLVLNFKGYIIGASAWCPNGYCPGLSGDPTMSTAQMTSNYDNNNHNLLGALQFAAKASEVWFMAIAVSLVFILTSLLARSEHGLPVGYMTAYTEFADLMYLLKPTLWTSAHSAPEQKGHKRKRRTMRYYGFGLFVAFTCLISNLIGPLVAVLMIPTLNWRETPRVYEHRFSSLLSAQPPHGNDVIQGCNAGNLTAGMYNCTKLFYGHSLDAMFEYFIAEFTQSNSVYGKISGNTPTPSKEQTLGIKFNFSDPNNDPGTTMYWAPSRQVARDLTQDIQGFFNATTNPTSEFGQWNNSLQLQLQRQGPIVGYSWSYIGTNVTVTRLAWDKTIRCYQHCFVDEAKLQPYAKCFRVGTGWNETNAIAHFTVGHDAPPIESRLNANDLNETVVTSAFFSDKAAWVPHDLYPGPNLTPCLPNGTAPRGKDCDYDALFADPYPAVLPQNFSEQSTDSFVVEHALSNDSAPVLMSEGHYALGFTTYAADVSAASPTWGFVKIDAFPGADAVTPLALHPSWYLATWSVRNGSNVPYTRVSARQLQLTMTNLQERLARGENLAQLDANQILWERIIKNSQLQAASFVPFAATDPRRDALSYAPDDPVHPSLWANARRQVWSFGLDTRTAKLAVPVLGVAVVLVLLRTALMLTTRVRFREPAELLIAALKHSPQGEFRAANGSATGMERMRFQIEDSPAEHIHFRKV